MIGKWMLFTRAVGFGMVFTMAAALRSEGEPSSNRDPGSSGRPQPRYVVLATDVSSSMNQNDPLLRDAEGKLQALRDDAQATFLQLLPFLHANSFVGVVQFAADVGYCQPAESSLPDAPLLPWRKTDLKPADLRQLVRSVDPKKYQRTRVDAAMDWALKRVELARKASGNGAGSLIILTDGDPDSAQKELAGTGNVMSSAATLASRGVQVHPVIINKASYRPGRAPQALAPNDRAAERLMEAVAAKTGGKVYRITATFNLLDVFTDILGDRGIAAAEKLRVSQHHRTVILIGSALKGVEVAPLAAAGESSSHVLPIQTGRDERTGIETRVIPLTTWNIVIFHRPASLEAAGGSWAGNWALQPMPGAVPYRGRIYRIPDFMIGLESAPPSPVYAGEEVTAVARLLENPRAPGEPEDKVPMIAGDTLTVRLAVQQASDGKTAASPPLQWKEASKTYESEPFSLSRPGPYEVVAECEERAGDETIALGKFQSLLDVAPGPAFLRLLKAPAGEVVLEVPASGSQATVGCTGGDQLHGELILDRVALAAGIDGTLRIRGMQPEEWPLRPKDDGRVTSETFKVPLEFTSLGGEIEVALETAAGARRYRLPAFDLPLGKAPLRLECSPGDAREALWSGELHAQTLTFKVFPVFVDNLREILEGFPKELPEVSMLAVDEEAGASRQIPVRCRLVDEPRREEAEKVPAVVATYRLEAEAPLPAVSRCVIQPGTIVAGLRPEETSYKVVEPVGGGVFTWRMGHDAGEDAPAGAAAVLYLDEPVHFAAAWSEAQHLSRVEFAIESGKGTPVDKITLVAPSTGSRAEMSQEIKGLKTGEKYSVVVHAVLKPDPAGTDVNLQLDGGEFLGMNRPLELTEIAIGAASGADIACRAWEKAFLPLQISFTGYVPGNPRHRRLIEEFKRSCRLAASGETEAVEGVIQGIDWPSIEAPADAGDKRGLCRLQGRAAYAPSRSGVLTLELTGEMEDEDGVRRLHTALARLSVGPPAVRLTVLQPPLGSEIEQVLFDSGRWAQNAFTASPAAWQLPRKLTLRLEREGGGGGDDAAALSDLECRVLLLQDDGAEAVFSRAAPLDKAGEAAVLEYTPVRNGKYAVEVVSRKEPSPGAPAISIRTPEIVSCEPVPIVPILQPSGKLTVKTRKWPFEYRIEIQPEWPVRPEALRFHFQMPGREDWFEGKTRIVTEGEKKWLVAEGPDFLPPLAGITDGAVTFRLSIDKDSLKFVWKSPSVAVADPRLRGVTFQTSPSGESAPAVIDAPLEAPVSLWASPELVMAPGLEGWTLKGVQSRVLRDPSADITAGPLSAETLHRLSQNAAIEEQDLAGDASRQRRGSPAPAERKPTVSVTPAQGFFGWPRPAARESYAVLVAALYSEEAAPENPREWRRGQPGERAIEEWSDVQLLTVATPLYIPPVWWLLGAGALAVIAVQLLRLLVPRPERTGVQLELAGGASLEPADPTNPLRAALRETTLRDEVRLQGDGGRGMKGRLQVFLPALLKRLFWPGRQAVIVLRPRVVADTDEVHTGLVRLVTSLRRRGGMLWSSTAGWRALPADAAGDRFTVNLAFKIRNQPRLYQVPVTLRVLRRRPEARTESGPKDGNEKHRRARGDGALQGDQGSIGRKG